MRHHGMAAALAGVAACYGCSFGEHSSEHSYEPSYATPSISEPQPPPRPDCVSSQGWARVWTLHDDTESSVHELIKCGGLQTRISRTFLVVVVASNRDLFDEASYAELVQFAAKFGVDLSVPLTPEGQGRWSTPLIPLNDSSFTLRFHDPATNEVITANPFVLESYVTSAVAKSTLTIADMEANLTTRNSITFAWKDRGELAPVLSGGAEIPNPFTISVSFADLAKWVFGVSLASGEPTLGPLGSLFDLQTDSEVVLSDEKGETTIEYDIAGMSATLREIGSRGVSYQVNEIAAHNGAYQLDGSASHLTYDAGKGGLVGRFDYRIIGPDGDVRVTDVYDPSMGMRTIWSCP